MRRLKVNLGELAFAFESGSHELSNYLDLETGEIIVTTDDTCRELAAIYEEMNVEEGEESSTLGDLLDEHGLPDWQKNAVVEADAVESGYGTRFIAVPQTDSHEGYRDMEDFIANVRNPHLRELLETAIMGRGAFRRFKDVLLNHPREEQQWFAFKDARMLERVREWLKEHEIKPISDRRGLDD